MKITIFKTAVILIGAVFLWSSSANAQWGWYEQYSGTTVNLISISAPTYDVAWVAGSLGTVKRTTDNGNTWVDKSIPAAADLWHIYALNANIAMAIGFNTDYTFNIIYRTADGGATWQTVLALDYPNEYHFLDAMTFFNNNEGIVYGDPVWNSTLNKAFWDVYKTYNGGLNWTPIANPPEQLGFNYGWKNAMTHSGNNVYFGTSLFDDNFNFGPDARIYKSSDKGLNWSFANTPGTVQVNTIQFVNSMTGYGCRAKTTDGGNTWFPMNDPYGGRPADINKFILSATGTGNEVWVTGIHRNGPSYFTDKWFNYRKLYYSNDGGITWKKDYESTTGGLNEVRISRDNMALYLLKDNGEIWMKPLTSLAAPGFEVKEYVLKPNYPNPFNPITVIQYQIPKSGFVTLKIYDILGKEVAALVNEVQNAGTFSVQWDASGLSSGMYFYRLESGSFSETRKMMLVK